MQECIYGDTDGIKKSRLRLDQVTLFLSCVWADNQPAIRRTHQSLPPRLAEAI